MKTNTIFKIGTIKPSLKKIEMLGTYTLSVLIQVNITDRLSLHNKY